MIELPITVTRANAMVPLARVYARFLENALLIPPKAESISLGPTKRQEMNALIDY